ncbi:DMT family transporter [Clostridium sp. CM028]|uniref:DMT family transporter n=1 Tax=Clostridium sp. CM028 TaxID=2851575 RepID=UPI001C6F4078|nr:DMT family transporter [Clostridium sp. CM028]MBW9147958.1 DMT family transporter [Clostridium sp. CM028]WLC61387.1 DMT family transporter [Clostridium sp. CM028]
MKITDKKKSILADMSLLLVAIFWGGGFIAVKGALDSLTPFYIMAMRFSISAIIMLLIFRKKVKLITKNELKVGTLVGLLLFLGFAAQTIGMKYTTAGKNAFLTGTNVVIVPFLYWIISKKKPDTYSLISAFLCFVGIGMLTLDGGIRIGLGDGLTLLCAVFFAAHIVSVGFFTEKVDAISLVIIQLGAAAVFSIIAALIYEPMPQSLNSDTIFAISYLAIFSTMIAFIIQNVAQKYTTSTHAAIILCLESVFGSILSVVMLNEIFTSKMILGCLIIFVAIITTETKLNFLKIKKISATP